MEKRYRSPSLNYSVSVMIDGKAKSIEFYRMSSDKKGTFYETSDKKIQDLLESSIGFNRRFFPDVVYSPFTIPAGIEPGSVPVRTDGIEKKTFFTVNEGKDFFTAEPYNLAVSKVQTKADIISEGLALGFEIVFDKK